MPQPCWQCGNLTVAKVSRKERVYCDGCKEEFESERKEMLNQYLGLKMEVMWQRAVNHLERQNVNMNHYYDEAQYVRELAQSNYNKFQSSAEMITAMELLRQKVKTKLQRKILNYRVDFFLPELKVVLEIDGRLHDFKVKKDSKRDMKILNELNNEDIGWEIIRIPTEHIETNVKQLIPAIKVLYNEKQRLRRKNAGFIPAWFSKHSMTEQRELTKSIENKSYNEKDSDLVVDDRLEEWEPEEL